MWWRLFGPKAASRRSGIRPTRLKQRSDCKLRISRRGAEAQRRKPVLVVFSGPPCLRGEGLLLSLKAPRNPARFADLMKIAVMPGDGVGKEVIPEGLKVLKQAAKRFGFTYSTTDYPFGGEYYLQTKTT